MGFCFKCSVFIALAAILLALAPLILQQLDQREFNARTTAEEAAKGNAFSGKTVIVTGASSGIGVPTAKVLYENGATVIMACRNKEKGERVRKEILSQTKQANLDAKNLKVMLLDLGSLKSVKSFADSFQKSYSKLNILINNAGIMGLDEYTLSTDGVESQFAVNNLGHFYLTQQLTPLLITSSSSSAVSRVINTASAAYLGSPYDIKSWIQSQDRMRDKTQYSPMRQYGLTKALNIIHAKEYNKRYASKGVYAVSLHPGGIKTGLQRYNKYLNLWKQYMPDYATKSVSQGAATQVRAAAMSEEEFKQNGGRYFEDCNPANLWRTDILDDGANSDELGVLFWNLCETIIMEKGFKMVA